MDVQGNVNLHESKLFWSFFFIFLGPHLQHMEERFQARGHIGTAAAGLHHSHSHIRSESHLAACAAACSNTRSLTH